MELIRTTNKKLIQDFLDKYWKQNHSLVKSNMLIDFQHLCSADAKYNYYLLTENDEIWGLLGYIPTSQYDPCLAKEKDVWGAIWKIRDDCPEKGLGLELMDKLLAENNSFAAVGISKIAKRIYRYYGMVIGELNQYYIANPNLTETTIGFNLMQIKRVYTSDHWIIKPMVDISGLLDIESTYRPRKSIDYLINRYQKHPFYKYIFWCIYDQDRLVSIWVIRRITVGNNSVYKIMDIYGNIECIPNIAYQIQTELKNEAVEYVDCLNYGIDAKVFEQIGFIKQNNDSDVILPNYFEPFVKSNVKIEFAYKADFDYVIFKGDSDQDRPNLL